MRKILALLFCAIIQGCTTTHQLAPEWAPLERIVEGNIPFVSDTAITTLGKQCFVVDLDEWLLNHPVNSDQYHAILLHEQVHAKRQLDTGLTLWLAKYVGKEFRWQEESLGWEKELKYLRSKGKAKQAEYYAQILSRMYNGMISYADALQWVRTILSSS